MNTGTLSQKRMIRNLEERHAAGKLKVNALDSNGLSLVHQFSYDGNMTGLQWAMQHGGSATARWVDKLRLHCLLENTNKLVHCLGC